MNARAKPTLQNSVWSPATATICCPPQGLKQIKKKHFVCNAATAACAEFAADCGVEIICADGVYERLKARGALPEKYTGEVKKVKFFARIKSRFTKKLCLPSFASGAALLFFSYFTYYPIYYIVTGSLLLLLCLAAAVFGKKERGLKRID